jgi:dTDP-4-amino-4,6-dideoxygalactose transaminase
MNSPVKHISFSAPLAQYHEIRDEIDEAIARVLNSGWYVLGREVEEFEKEFAIFCGTKYAVGCASGTEAITLALMALGIEQGDEVITVPNTAVPTVCGVMMAGAKPVFVDIDSTYHMNPKLLDGAISKMTRAIVPVHLYGQTADMEAINEVAHRHNLYVIEDACQAHGAEFKGCRAGSLGRVGCFSFYPTKNLGCFGDGGAVTTDDPEVYDKLLLIRNYGQKKRYYHQVRGINSRLDEIQAAVLRVKLKYLNSWNERRRNLASVYDLLLSNVCAIPFEVPGNRHVYHLYVIRTGKRESLQEFLKRNEIETLIHYPLSIYSQEAYKDINHQPKDFPQTEKFAKEIVSLPLHPQMTKNDVKYVCEKIIEHSIAGSL